MKMADRDVSYNSFDQAQFKNLGWAKREQPKPLPRLQDIMAEGFDLDRALKLRQYLCSIDNGDLDWKAEVNAIKAAVNDKFDDAMRQMSRWAAEIPSEASRHAEADAPGFQRTPQKCAGTCQVPDLLWGAPLQIEFSEKQIQRIVRLYNEMLIEQAASQAEAQ
jgi:hypothetical protein